MIFISVDLPAPFSPTRPWISPDESEKRTSRSAVTPPNDLVIPESSSSGGATIGSDQEMRLHPGHAWRIRLRHHWAVGDDILRDAACACFFTSHHGGNASHNGSAVNAAGWIADCRMHPAVYHGGQRRRHRIAAANKYLGSIVRLHHIIGGQGHVIVVEVGGTYLGVFGQQGFPDTSHFRNIPVGWLSVEHLDFRILLDDRFKASRTTLGTRVAQSSLCRDHGAFAVDGINQRLGDRGAHEFIVRCD